MGQRPIAEHNSKYEWLYAYSFVRPEDGKSYWLILPRANTKAMSVALAEFAKDLAPKGDKRILLLLDRASYHTTDKLCVPEQLELHFLPPRSPELQPAEAVFPLLREPLANRAFAELDDLENVTEQRCCFLMDNLELVKGEVGFQWLVELG